MTKSKRNPNVVGVGYRNFGWSRLRHNRRSTDKGLLTAAAYSIEIKAFRRKIRNGRRTRGSLLDRGLVGSLEIHEKSFRTFVSPRAHASSCHRDVLPYSYNVRLARQAQRNMQPRPRDRERNGQKGLHTSEEVRVGRDYCQARKRNLRFVPQLTYSLRHRPLILS